MDRVEKFRALHVPGDPLVLFNIWDAGSARAVAEAGAKAIATGSFAVAETNGFKDGETLPIEIQAIRIGACALVGIPVEPFAAIGVQVKALSPFATTFFSGVTLANSERILSLLSCAASSD